MSYVEHVGLSTPPGPLLCEDVDLWSFWLRADAGKLATSCENALQAPSSDAVIVKPLLPLALLVFARLGRVSSTSEPYNGMGHIREREVAVFVPVVVRTPRAGQAPRAQFAAFISHIFLDNPMSITSGREIYGYQKNWGWPAFPDDAGATDETFGARPDAPPGTLALDAFAIKSYSPSAKPERRRLLTMTPHPGAGSGAGVALGDPGAAVRWSSEQILSNSDLASTGISAGLKVLRGWMPPFTVQQLLIRQLRAAAGGLGADHQDILTAPATVLKDTWSGGVSLPPHDLEIERLDSHPIRDLGISNGPALAGFRSSLSFTVGGAKTLWSAGR